MQDRADWHCWATNLGRVGIRLTLDIRKQVKALGGLLEPDRPPQLSPVKVCWVEEGGGQHREGGGNMKEGRRQVAADQGRVATGSPVTSNLVSHIHTFYRARREGK